MNARLLGEHVRLEERGEEMLRTACERGLLSVRGEHRALRVARTIADLRGSGRVQARDVGAALALRPLAPPGHGHGNGRVA
jgi:magnesium chelatase family protein